MPAGARDECVMASGMRTTTNRCLPDGIITVDQHCHLWEPALPLSADESTPLAFRHLEMLPAEDSRIDGPCTRSDHRQCGTQRCQHDGNPSAGARIRNPDFNDCDQRSTDRSP